jgi:LysR family transcriptional regulator, glycine cleavage system transcriptional activator
MKIRSPSMSELHAFATAMRLGSFTAAAAHLCVTQSAISRSVARLEAHFGIKLLNRTAAELSLTERGVEFLQAIEAPLAAIEQASEELVQSRKVRSELVLSAVPTFSSMWLIPRLHDFQRRHPSVSLKFVPYRKGEDFTGKVPDAAILTGFGSTQWPQLDCAYITGRDVVPVCHPVRAARLAGRGPEALAQEPLLSHVSSPERWEDWFSAVGVQGVQPNVAATLDQVSILLQAAIADMGIAIIHRCLARDAIESGQLVMPFDIPIELSRGYYLCAPQQHASMPSLQAFRHWLVEMAELDKNRPFALP